MGLERGNDVVHDSLGQFREGLGALKAAREAGYDVVAHYVVARRSVISQRLDDREKTDPRRVPRTIVDASIDNNRYAMPEIAEFADEFYLYDGSGDSRKLIARKVKGGKLEILDPIAYKFGNFENLGDELDDRENYFERPNTDGRTQTVAKNARLADVIRDFDKGAKVSDLSRKYNMSNRQVWEAVTTYSVDENRTEAPRQQRNPRFNLGSQDELDFGPWYDASAGAWFHNGEEIDYDGDGDYIDPSSRLFRSLNTGEDPQELPNILAETADAGMEDELFEWITLRQNASSKTMKSLRGLGWTDGTLRAARKNPDLIRVIFDKKPSGKRQDLYNKMNEWLDALSKEEKTELTGAVNKLADDAKQGIFAPTNEFVGLSEEFSVPLWVVDQMYEDRFNRGVTGKMAGEGSKTQFVEPRPNIPKKELTADDVKVIKYPDSDVPALKLPVIDEIISIIHPDNPRKSKDKDLQNDDYSFVDYLRGVQYPTEPQIQEINKFIADQQKKHKRATSNWNLTAPDGSTLGPKTELPEDIDFFEAIKQKYIVDSLTKK